MLQITSTNEEKIRVTLAPVTAAGNAVMVENVVFIVDSGDATVEEIDPNREYFVISGTGGLSTITVTADADLGEGVTTITDSIEYFVTEAQASSFGFIVGGAELK